MWKSTSRARTAVFFGAIMGDRQGKGSSTRRSGTACVFSEKEGFGFWCNVIRPFQRRTENRFHPWHWRHFQGGLGPRLLCPGNPLHGDCGSPTECAYLARDAVQADAHLYGMDFGIIVQAIPLGLPPGRLTCRNHEQFKQNIRLLRDSHDTLAQLEPALLRTAMAEALPAALLFVWMEPSRLEGFGLSKEGGKALRTAVRLIKMESSPVDAFPHSCYGELSQRGRSSPAPEDIPMAALSGDFSF